MRLQLSRGKLGWAGSSKSFALVIEPVRVLTKDTLLTKQLVHNLRLSMRFVAFSHKKLRCRGFVC